MERSTVTDECVLLEPVVVPGYSKITYTITLIKVDIQVRVITLNFVVLSLGCLLVLNTPRSEKTAGMPQFKPSGAGVCDRSVEFQVIIGIRRRRFNDYRRAIPRFRV